MAPKNKKNVRNGMTWAQAVRDMVIASMNKGQLPLLAICAMIIIVLWRIPPKDLSIIVDKVFLLIENRILWSYILNGILIFAWFFHARFLRKESSSECARMGNEKSSLQNKYAGRKFKSSD